MRLFVLLTILFLPAMADNSVTITGESGGGCPGCTFKIARYFAKGEIVNYPKPRVGGTSAAIWQAEVKTRWDDNSVRFAVIYVEATISGSKSINVDFVNDPNSRSQDSNMTKQEMLDFDAGGGPASWGCKIRTSVGGATLDTSCRDMLANDHYQLLENGPLATTILIREGPGSVAGGTTRQYSFGYVCTASCDAPYASSSWHAASSESFKSMRPSFVVTFYRRWKRVRTHDIIDNGWTDRLQDQRFRLLLFDGGAENNQVYDSSVEIVIPARSRIMEEVWSTAPNVYSLDLNTQYMESTRVIPEFGNLTISSQAIALEKAQFDSSDRGATVGAAPPHLGWGQWTRGMGQGGGRPDLGLFPRWSARLILAWDQDLWTVVLGNAKAMMHASFWYLEYDNARNYCGTSDCGLGGGTITAFGRPISNDSRPDMAYHSNAGYTPSQDVPSPVGTVTITPGSDNRPWTAVSSSNAVNKWQLEMAHPPEAFFVPYLVTGDYVYLEALQAWAQYRMLLNPGRDPPRNRQYSHWGSKAIINDLLSRSIGWSMRDLAHAALMSTDGTPEGKYFNEKLQNNLAWEEGRLGITDGSYYPIFGKKSCVATPSNFNSETDVWCAGHMWFTNDHENPLRFPVLKFSLPYTEGMNGDTVFTGARLWMDNYWRVVMGHVGELFPQAEPVARAAGEQLLHLVKDSSYNLMFQAAAYNIPAQSDFDTFLTTYAAVREGYVLSAALARDLGRGSKAIYITGLLNSFWTMDAGDTAVLTVDSEKVAGNSYTITPIQDSCTADPGTDIFTCGKHPFQAGDMVKLVANSAPGGTTNGRDYPVEVLNGDTVKLCTSSACSDYVDITSPGSGVKLGMLSFAVTRGYGGTSEASHSAGATVNFTGRTVLGGSVTHSYAMIFRAALSFAVGHGVSVTDEGNGSTISAQSAWDTFNAALSGTSRFGSNTNCGSSHLAVAECDNPTWGFYPRLAMAPALKVATNGLPNGTRNVTYSETLLAANGHPPYTWDLASGDLCGGLVLQSSGMVTGKPNLAGPCSFTVRVTDTSNTIATRALSITIADSRNAGSGRRGVRDLR